jgi:hypothetical protein
MRLYQRLLMLASVCLTAIVGALVVSPSAMATPPTTHSYMMVNDAYPTKCLSANNSTPPGGGAGTYMVYLADCNPATMAQWWTMPPQYPGFGTMNHYLSDRCLSTNFSTPQGGGVGTHAAYNTACGSGAYTHYWSGDANPDYTGSIYKYKLVNYDQGTTGVRWCLSATSSNPYPGGTYRVYTSQCNYTKGTPGTTAQNWRPYQP